MKFHDKVGYEKFSIRKRRRVSPTDLFDVPTIDISDIKSIRHGYDSFKKYQLLLIKSAPKVDSSAFIDYIFNVIRNYPHIVSKSWSIENIGNQDLTVMKGYPSESFLRDLSDPSFVMDHQWYVSFILQYHRGLIEQFLLLSPYSIPLIFPVDTSSVHVIDANQESSNQENSVNAELIDPDDSLISLLKVHKDQLFKSIGAHTEVELDKQRKVWGAIQHTSPIWIFLGRNSCAPTSSKLHKPIQGRVEHTDSVQHSGTWHYQVTGTKIWYVRPLKESSDWQYGTPTLRIRRRKSLRNCNHSSAVSLMDDGEYRLKIVCEPGDFLLINTRLWWHSTELPETHNATKQLSLSYARDFYLDSGTLNSSEGDADMTNIEGLYAAKNVSVGNIVLTEDELPDCSLARSADANCEVVEIDDGKLALMAVRNIQAGDWLTVPISDDEEGI